MEKQTDTVVSIDIDSAIEKWNENNPTLRKLTRQDVFDEVGITKPTLQNWKKGKVPKAVINLVSIMAMTGVSFTSLVTAEKDGESII